MTTISRREILAALASIGAVAAAPALSQTPLGQIDLSAGQAIGQAYLAAHPAMSAAKLRRTQLPNGLDRQAATRLRARAAADFRNGRLFIHEGWRLSETEAKLFALLSSANKP